MTLHIVLSCPNSSPYRAKVSVQDQVYDPHEKVMTDHFREDHVIVLDPGKCAATYLTSSRRLVVTEEELPKIPAEPVDTEKLVTLQEHE